MIFVNLSLASSRGKIQISCQPMLKVSANYNILFLNYMKFRILIYFFIDTLDNVYIHSACKLINSTTNVVNSNPAQTRCTRYNIM